MAIKKEHKEFHALDMTSGWETPAGYPAGIPLSWNRLLAAITIGFHPLDIETP